jgi:hypothetical protein
MINGQPGFAMKSCSFIRLSEMHLTCFASFFISLRHDFHALCKLDRICSVLDRGCIKFYPTFTLTNQWTMKTKGIIPQEKSMLGQKRQQKLIKKFPGYMTKQRTKLVRYFGEDATRRILSRAAESYPEIVSKVSTFHTSMYDALMIQASKMAALKKGLNSAGISTEEFVRFNIEETRLASKRIPSWMKTIGGHLYLSRLMRRYLKRVGKRVSANGWPTEVIDGTGNEGIEMIVETRDCQMIAFWESIGEGDIKPYCTFFDFSAAEMLGIGLKQVSSIDSGICRYCFSKTGEVQWPAAIQKILNL